MSKFQPDHILRLCSSHPRSYQQMLCIHKRAPSQNKSSIIAHINKYSNATENILRPTTNQRRKKKTEMKERNCTRIFISHLHNIYRLREITVGRHRPNSDDFNLATVCQQATKFILTKIHMQSMRNVTNSLKV